MGRSIPCAQYSGILPLCVGRSDQTCASRHWANRAVFEPFGHQSVALEGHTLVSHLRGDLVLSRGRGQSTGLVDRPGERLLAVDVLSPLDGRHRDDRVQMVRRAHNDRVDSLFLVEQFPEIFVFRGPWILVERVRRVAPIDVGQRDDVLVVDLFEVPATLAADAHTCDVQFFAWWRMAGAAQDMAGHNANCGSGGTECKYLTTSNLGGFHCWISGREWNTRLARY